MHAPLRDGLEEYLAGKPDAGLVKHLSECAECREMVTLFEDQAKVIRVLKSPESFEPPPGFYGRVMNRIEEQKSTSIWSVFLEPLFARRLMYATAALTLTLGVFLFTSPKDEGTMMASTPEQILAEEPAPMPQLVDAESDRNTVFVQFATFQGE